MSSSLISFILKGEKHLNLEQAAELADYLGLSNEETEYFFLLVEYGKAGTKNLSSYFKNRINLHQKKLSNRISKQVELNEEVKSIYYSSWIYSGIRNLTATPGPHSIQSIANRLNIPTSIVGPAIEFLLKNGLCKIENKQLTYGLQKTHVGADSPFVNKHHQNWRLQGLQAMEKRNAENLFFTGPMSLSKKAAEEIHQLLPKLVKQVMDISSPSDSEITYCLNFDWFEY